jgi:hypothetical protein
MNRHARLAREFSPGERAAWAEKLIEFSEATKGFAEAVVVLAQNQQALAAGVAAGDPTASAVMAAIAGWFDVADAQPKPPLCLSCDTAFRNGVFPAGFVILMPFADPTCAIATGVCVHCSTRDDLLETAMQQWSRLWPALHTIKGGRA